MDAKTFEKKAREAVKEQGNFLRFEEGKTVVGKFIGLKDINFKNKKGKKQVAKIITLEIDKQEISYWSFGLLNWLINDRKVKAGEMIFIEYLGKGDNDYHKCNFKSESEVLNDRSKNK